MKALPYLIAAVLVSSVAHSREWKNAEGRVIEADFISSDGAAVKLRMNGRDVSYPLANLSKEDQEWVAAQEEGAASAAGEEEAAILTGFHRNVPITSRLFPEIKDYFSERTRKSVLEAFEAGAFPREGEGPPENWFRREEGKDHFQLYVPPSYDGKEAYGLYLHINSGDGGDVPDKWRSLFDERKVISVSANGTGNLQPMLRRVMLSMDAMHTVRQTYKIDPKRTIVGGLSGGGHMAMLTAAVFPEHFVGAVSHAAQSYLPGEGTFGHFPGMTAKDFKRSPRKDLRWVVVSGDKDYNYQEILTTGKEWEAQRLDYRFIDVPGMDHTTSTAEKLGEAFDWILEKK